MNRKYHVKITSSGFIYIVITIVISVAAINTGNNLLYLISSLLLALMALSGFVSLVNLFFLDISLNSPREIFADISARFELTIRKRYWSSFFIRFETGFGSTFLPYLRKNLVNSMWLRFPNRGKIMVDDLRLHSGFPLGFFRRYKRCPTSLEILVYPRPIPSLFLPPTGGLHGNERRSEYSFGEIGDEIKELRDYRPSDPLKWMDWKATARRGRAMVREFYHLEGDSLIIDLSKKSDPWEKRLSEACYLVLEAYKRKLSVSLRLPDMEIGLGDTERHKITLLEALALA